MNTGINAGIEYEEETVSEIKKRKTHKTPTIDL